MKKYKLGEIGCGFVAWSAGTANQTRLPSLVRVQAEGSMLLNHIKKRNTVYRDSGLTVIRSDGKYINWRTYYG